MVSQHEIDFISMELSEWKKQTSNLANEIHILQGKYDARGKSLNKLWEKNKGLRKEIVTLQKFCGRLTLDLAKLQLENRLIIPAETGADTQILVRDLLKQLINESGYDLQFKVLQVRYPTKRVRTKPTLTITGKQIKK